MGTSLRRLGLVTALVVAGAGCGSDADRTTSSSNGTITAAEDTAAADADTTAATVPPAASETTDSRDGSSSTGSSVSQQTLAAGPVTLIAVGDSLTAGEGDESGQGFVGRLADSIGASEGRADPSVVNLGQSGWDSTMVLSGTDGASAGELAPAVDAVEEAIDNGRVPLVTLLIGSNDMWYLYEYGPPNGTGASDEDTAEETFRNNLDRTVRTLLDAGAVVVLGLPDDQSLRPSAADADRLHEFLPDVTQTEIGQMSVMAARLGRVVESVANEHGLATVDTNAAFWADPTMMADDGIHPNPDGYTELAALWFAVIRNLL